MTTYADFVSGLAGLPIAGVRRQYGHPPESLDSADLPASWVQLPRGEERPFFFQDGQRFPNFRADLVVALRPIAQGTQAQNFSAAVEMMDAVADALRRANICLSALSWRIRVDSVEVAGVAYWAVVAEVEGRG